MSARDPFTRAEIAAAVFETWLPEAELKTARILVAWIEEAPEDQRYYRKIVALKLAKMSLGDPDRAEKLRATLAELARFLSGGDDA